MRTKERLRKFEMVLRTKGEDNKVLSNLVMVLYEDDNQEEILEDCKKKYGEEPWLLIEVEGKRPPDKEVKEAECGKASCDS